jgi:hypothetical protein
MLQPPNSARRPHRHRGYHLLIDRHAARRRTSTAALGCAVVRRIADDRGREWRVRQVLTPAGQALLFQCAVRGVRSELRPARAALESLSDDELVTALETAEE